MRLMIAGWLVAVLASAALAATSPFVGSYKGEDVMLEIKETAAGQFAGTIIVDGESVRFTAREQGAALIGALTLDDGKLPFKLTLKGTTLTFTVGGESQTLTRQDQAAAPPDKPATTAAPAVGAQILRVNGVVIEAERVRKFEQENRTQIPRGDYWYDKVSGAWGIAGGPTLGFTAPGMDLGGPLKADASRGDTGVFINGRQLPLLDVRGLQSLNVPVQQGRWWMDHQGNFGVEGEPTVMGNVFQYSRGKGGSYQRATAGGYIGSDGQTSYFFDPKTGASVMTGP